MKKFLNSVDTVLTESLDGFVAAHSDILLLGEGHKFVRRRILKPGKVALISGGGSGHEPLHAGLVGHGMLDAACPGQVFTSPTPDQMVEAAASVDTGAGCLFIVKNYEGDVMNFDMAAEMTEGVMQVVTNDDVAVEDSLYTTGRRGVAGTLVVEKIVGAAAEEGRSLAELKALGDRVNAATRSMGVALTSCTVPAAGKPTFEIGDDEMEFGVGIHGEPGRRRDRLKTADEIAEEICAAIAGDLGPQVKGKALLFVNGFGGTPSMELYLMYNAARRMFEKHGVEVARSLVGSYVTSLDMAGCSVTLSMLDDEAASLWDAPVHTASLRWGM
ncbi:MAG TPA: dihydroxyacetone kinase subunit DhaK [Rhizobiaceae bacterium]|nr:dihydroxyacetone kinase subunit DhaK [Rhizobiaceae bacterium]